MVVNFAQVKGAVRISKALFFSYSEKVLLIQLTRSGPLRSWPKFEGFLGVFMEKTSSWWRAGSMMGWPWSKKARCSSREMSAEGRH